jgi:hypothetical protein
MALTYRPITGTWTLPQGAAPGRAVATLTLVAPDWTASDLVIPEVIQLVADEDGDVVPGPTYDGTTVEVGGKDRAVIWASEEGAQQVTYRVAIIGTQELYAMGEYLIPPGESALTLQDILELGIPSPDPRFLTVQSYIDSLTIAPAYGQCSRTTLGPVTITTLNEYVLANVAPTLDAANSVDVALADAGMGLKYTGEFARAVKVYASADVSDGNNKSYGLRLALNGTTVPETECRAFHTFGAQEAKLVTQWIFTLQPNDQVQMYFANHTDTSNLEFRRGRVIMTSIAGFVAPE